MGFYFFFCEAATPNREIQLGLKMLHKIDMNGYIDSDIHFINGIAALATWVNMCEASREPRMSAGIFTIWDRSQHLMIVWNIEKILNKIFLSKLIKRGHHSCPRFHSSWPLTISGVWWHIPWHIFIFCSILPQQKAGELCELWRQSCFLAVKLSTL